MVYTKHLIAVSYFYFTRKRRKKDYGQLCYLGSEVREIIFVVFLPLTQIAYVYKKRCEAGLNV